MTAEPSLYKRLINNNYFHKKTSGTHVNYIMNYVRTACLKQARKMGNFADTLQSQAAGGIVGAADSILGIGLGMATAKWADNRQYNQQARLQQLALQGQQQMADYQKNIAYDMWQKTGPVGQMEQLKKAGLNPALIYEGGAPGGQTITPSGSINQAHAPQGGNEIGMGIQSILQAQQIGANIELTKAQAELARVQANKAAGVDTDEAKTRIANNILDGVIKDFTGREAKDVYERVTSPNRGIQAKTYEDELSARQGVAGTIYELWVEGKLKEKSLAEIEGLIKQNSKTQTEIDNNQQTLKLLKSQTSAQDINNALNELELRLQKETGIDRNSPFWLKMAGRLFAEFMTK